MVKILLDEHLPTVLKYDLAYYDTYTVEDMRWKSLKNGELLKRAKNSRFTVMITMDRSIQHQQPLAKFGIALILLRAKDNQYSTLKPFVPLILKAVPELKPGAVAELVLSEESSDESTSDTIQELPPPTSQEER